MTDLQLDALAAKVGARLGQLGLMLATAESCTGGGIAAAVTAIAGSSGWFERGFVTYSNGAKESMLGVAAATLAVHGAVSEAVALEMASGALRHSGAQVALSVTGVAGPGGGTPAKPVGTVCFAWVRADGVQKVQTCVLAGDRAAVRAQSVVHALTELLAILEN